MVSKKAKRDIDPMPYAARDGPARPKTMIRNEIIVVARVPIRAMTKRSPRLSGNFF